MAVEKPVAFVVLTTQRSGSTWLIDLLNQLDDVTAYGELFLDRKRTWDAGALDFPRFCEASTGGRRLRTSRYLNDLYSRPGSVGFKLMYSQLRRNPALWAYFSRHDVKVVHLVRSNLLDVVISKARVKETGQAHLTSDAAPAATTGVALDPKTLVAELRRQDRKISLIRQLVRLHRQRSIEVHYEELRARPAEFDRLFTFLGQNVESPPESGIRKITTSDHRSVLANYDEVAAAIGGSRYAHLLT